MGKRVATQTEPHHDTPPSRNIRKRKRDSNTLIGNKSQRLTASSTQNSYWQEHENDDEDSSSNDATPLSGTNKYANNSSALLLHAALNASNPSPNESPKPTYTLRPSVVNGTILYDITEKPWRLGTPIGKGNFGEIFLASDNITVPVSNANAKFVVKIEPHANGPLFVEIHCLMNTAKKHSNGGPNGKAHTATKQSQTEPSGIPDYIASGSHYFGGARYRFLVLPRFDRDLYSLIKNSRVHQKYVLTLAVHIVKVLENLHNKGYCHNDVKAQNLMISKCRYYNHQSNKANNVDTKKSKIEKISTKDMKSKYAENYDEKQQTTDSGNSSEQETNEDDEDFVVKRRTHKSNHNDGDDEEDDEDFDDGETTNSNNSNTMGIYETPVKKNRKAQLRINEVEYSGSNPVRACRRPQHHAIYEEMVKSHYLRPAKRISYSEFFNEDGTSNHSDNFNSANTNSSDEDSEEFVPSSMRRASAFKPSNACKVKRLTRRQEKLSTSPRNLSVKSQNNVTAVTEQAMIAVEEERIFLIDFGLASKFMDNGVHRPFVMDQRRAHDGTLEFTSRDAHMGAHSRRSDLECLGFNLIYWSQGYLPWKEAASQHQREKVHRAKEYLMTDVREMLKQIYGKQVPKYLGEFLHHIGKLAYHERPDYALYRRIFQREFEHLGYSIGEMELDSTEIGKTCVRFKDEIENKYDIFELNKNNTSANVSVGTPFHECTLSNRVSPKNLRSKSDKKSVKKKKFSWAEILSQDPDQIARERAEKEFDREEELSEVQQPVVRRYEGNPTYAILEIQQRLKLSGRLVEEQNDNAEEMEKWTEEESESASELDTDDSNVVENEYKYTDEEVERDTGESDGSEEPLRTNGRSKRSRNTKQTKATAGIGRNKTTNNNIKRASTTKTKKTRSITHPSTESDMMNASNKRETMLRNGRKGMASAYQQPASAAGEVENGTARYLSNGHGVNGVGRPPERRTRRCPLKTDTEADETNTNLSPDGRSLHTATAKHHKK